MLVAALGWGLPEIFREVFIQADRGVTHLGRLIGRMLPYLLGGLALVFLANHEPRAFSDLIAIAIMIFGIQFMVRKVFPKGKKK